MKFFLPFVGIGLLANSLTADTQLSTASLPGGASAVGAYTLASVDGQASTLDPRATTERTQG